jgi:putative ABC transport system substrate-binding protein
MANDDQPRLRLSRRTFVLGGAGAGLAAAGLTLLGSDRSRSASPPTSRQVATIGYLSPAPNDPSNPLWKALAQRGWVYGDNLTVVYRAGAVETFPELAAELVRLGVALIVAQFEGPVRAAMNATGTIPIVMAYAEDAVGSGLVASLARPGGNVTGLSVLGPELAGKQLELLHEIDPSLVRAGVLWHPAVAAAARDFSGLQRAAQTLGVELVSVLASSANQVQPALASIHPLSIDGLIVLPLVAYSTPPVRRVILSVASQHRLPSVVPQREWVSEGGLMSYAPKLAASLERAAVYVDSILRGARPADLPVEQPTEFDFTVNYATVQALGLTVPPEVTAQVSEWVQS